MVDIDILEGADTFVSLQGKGVALVDDVPHFVEKVLESEGEITGIWGIYSEGDDRWMDGLKFHPDRLRVRVFASNNKKVVK